MSDTATAAEGTVTESPADSIVTTDEVASEQPTESSTGIEKPSWYSDGEASEEKKEDSKGDDQKSDDSDDVKESDKPATSEPNTEDAEKDEEDTDDTKQDDKEDDSTDEKEPGHPKGYVPVGAVREARAENKVIKSENYALKEQVAELQEQLKSGPAVEKQSDKFEGFEVLTDEQLELLADDEPTEAAKYVKNLVAYERHVANQEATKGEREKQDADNKIQLQVALDRIEEVLPKGDNEAQDALADFAIKNGLSEGAFILTDPNTLVIKPGEKNPVPLNQLAADVVGLLANVQKAAAEKGELSINDIPDDLKAQIVSEAQEKIVNKVKGSKTKRSVSNIPSSNREQAGDKFAGKTYAEMTEQERREYMGG